MQKKVLIIGGVAGGASAAARLRRLDEKARIVLLERGGYISYANCGLPYYVGGEITDRAKLTLQTPESFQRRFNVEVRVKEEATAIDPARKAVRICKLETGEEYEESYDFLILSPGAEPLRPPIPGADDPAVFTLRTIPDTFRIREFLEERRPKRALVVGGGYIGLEMAENLVHAGLLVTVVEMADHVVGPLDGDMACDVQSYLRKMGVTLYLRQAVGSIRREDGCLTVSMGDSQLQTDLVLLSAGVRPESGLAAQAGIELSPKGAILTDERMRTSAPDIYAVGDAVQIKNFVTGADGYIPLAGPANKQGRIAADNICGIPSVYRGTQGSSILKLFDMTVAATGLNEQGARAAGLSYDKVYLYSASHASYYPGAENMSLKVLFELGTGRILGAQIVGLEGVDKRIDVLATAIRAKLTAFDLTELELAYAPPFSSAKDPVNMAGYVMENLLTGKVEQYHWHDVACLPRDGSAVLLDVRTRAEYERGHIPGAVNVPLDELRGRMGELPREKQLYVNCQSGLRSYIACRILTQSGFHCHNLAGGYRLYEAVTGQPEFDPTPRHPCGIKI